MNIYNTLTHKIEKFVPNEPEILKEILNRGSSG